MARIDWGTISKEEKQKIFDDIYDNMDAPCGYEGYNCPFEHYGLDCDKDNDNHCLVREFIKYHININ